MNVFLDELNTASVWFQTDHKGYQLFRVCTRRRLRTYPAPGLARLDGAYCRRFRKSGKTFDLSTAGKKLWWPITCYHCGTHYEIETEYGVKNPFTLEEDKGHNFDSSWQK